MGLFKKYLWLFSGKDELRFFLSLRFGTSAGTLSERKSRPKAQRISLQAVDRRPLVSLNQGQKQERGMRAVMVDVVDRLHKIRFRFRGNRASCIGVAVKTREVATGDLQADTMIRLEDIRCRSQIEMEFIDLSWFHQDRG